MQKGTLARTLVDICQVASTRAAIVTSTPTLGFTRPKDQLAARPKAWTPPNPALWTVGMNALISEHATMISSPISNAANVEHRQPDLDPFTPLITFADPQPSIVSSIIVDCLRHGHHCFRPRELNASRTKEKGNPEQPERGQEVYLSE